MEKVWIDLFKEWDVEKESGCMTLRFSKPQQAAGFSQYGFVRKNDSAADFVDWYGFSLEVKAAENRKVPDGKRKKTFLDVFSDGQLDSDKAQAV